VWNDLFGFPFSHQKSIASIARIPWWFSRKEKLFQPAAITRWCTPLTTLSPAFPAGVHAQLLALSPGQGGTRWARWAMPNWFEWERERSRAVLYCTFGLIMLSTTFWGIRKHFCRTSFLLVKYVERKMLRSSLNSLLACRNTMWSINEPSGTSAQHHTASFSREFRFLICKWDDMVQSNKDRLLMVSVSVCPQLIWKGDEYNLEQIYPLYFFWTTFLQEHQGKQKLSKLWAEWHCSWFWTIGSPTIWWLFDCQKKENLPRKIKIRVWVSKVWTFFFPFKGCSTHWTYVFVLT